MPGTAAHDLRNRCSRSAGIAAHDGPEYAVIDLLPVRTAESLASWLEAHPGAEVIARDRSTLFADGGYDGAPDAVHVIDRFHLVSNLTEAVERDVQRLQAQPPREAPATAGGETAKIERVNWKEARRRRCRAARYQRYLAVVAAEREGLTQLAIAARVGLGADTVAGWLHAGAFPERQIRSDRVRLHRPVESGGFSDDDSLAPHAASSTALPPTPRARHFSAGRVAALPTQPPGKLTPPQGTYLDGFLDRWPEGRSLRRLVLSFRAMLRWRRSSLLGPWLDKAAAAGFPFVARYASALGRDRDGVGRSITSLWSNGPVEGQINRLKVIKRQMYGRAGVELLRARVLPLTPLAA